MYLQCRKLPKSSNASRLNQQHGQHMIKCVLSFQHHKNFSNNKTIIALELSQTWVGQSLTTKGPLGPGFHGKENSGSRRYWLPSII